MKHPRSVGRARLAALVLALVALASVGCQRVGKPDGWAAPVQVGDLTIVQQQRGKLAAVRLGAVDDPLTEKIDERIAWTFPGENDDLDLTAVYANPIVDGDTVYVAGYSGELVALDVSQEPPRIRWRVTLRHHIVATPAYDGDTLYVATEGGELIPVDVARGVAGASMAHAGERIWSHPILKDGSIYLPALDKRVRAVGVAGGEEQWSRTLSGAIPGDPVLESDLLVVGSLDRTLHALDAQTGAEEWSFAGDGWFWAQPLVAGDVVYAASTRGSIYALHLDGGDDGREIWRFNELDSEIRVAPVLMGGVLVVAAEEGMIFGIDPGSGDSVWTAPLVGKRFLADPMVSGSNLIYATTHGDLVQLDPQSGQLSILFERS